MSGSVVVVVWAGVVVWVVVSASVVVVVWASALGWVNDVAGACN